MTDKLIAVDLSAETIPAKSLINEISELNQLHLVKFEKVKFRADVTGQMGSFCYVVQGRERTYRIGADTLSQLHLATKLDIVMTPAVAKDFSTSKHYSILKNAMRRQKAKESEK